MEQAPVDSVGDVIVIIMLLKSYYWNITWKVWV